MPAWEGGEETFLFQAGVGENEIELNDGSGLRATIIMTG